MDITKQGEVSALISTKTATVVLNPAKKQGKATILLTTYPITMAGWEITREQQQGQIYFTGPGEYEKEGVILQGIGSQTQRQGKQLQTTSWILKVEDITVVVLGDIDSQTALKKVTTEVGEADVVITLVPEDKEKRPSATEYAASIAALQTKKALLIGNNKKLIGALTKEIGTSESVTGKYTIKKKDIEANTTLTAVVL